MPDSNNNSYYQWREDVEGDNIYGDGVNVAARIHALADPGGIYVSRGAAEQVRDKVPIKIETRGERTVKNIARPPANIAVVNSPTLLKAVLKALSARTGGSLRRSDTSTIGGKRDMPGACLKRRN